MCVTFNNYLNLIFICLPITIIQGVPTVDSNRSVIASETSQVLEHCNKQNLFELPDIGAITELVARDCDIEELENAFFIRFTSLESLEISDSGLSTLQDYALHGLNNLKTLSLARNNLSEVRSWSNEPMSALISLDLRRNNIRELTLKSFIRYPNLQRLNLAVNLLEDIDDGIFRWMPHLKYLNLGKNRLLSIDNRNFHGMHSLGYLALHFNGLQDIEANSFSTNSHLRTLRLEGNKLADLDFLNISLVRLAHLNLSNNALESLELLTFSKDYNLTTLDVSFNNLKEVQVGTFSGLKSLENLNISHNSLTQIELGSFNDLHSLLRIDLSHNRLIKLPTNIFRTTTHLQHINLSNNTLHTLNDTIFSGMSHLHVLNLSANLLSRIDDCLEHLDSDLQRAEMSLDLSDNQFQLVNISTLADFQEVALAGNRWSCKWLIQEMLRIPHTIHFERKFAVLTASSSGVLDVSGIDCFDIERQRSIVILDTGRVWMQQRALECGQNDQQSTPTVPPLHWPRIPTDKFDSRSVIIWMLIAIALAFSGLRIARHLVEQKEHKKKLKAIRDEHIAQNMENEKLNNDLNQP